MHEPALPFGAKTPGAPSHETHGFLGSESSSVVPATHAKLEQRTLDRPYHRQPAWCLQTCAVVVALAVVEVFPVVAFKAARVVVVQVAAAEVLAALRELAAALDALIPAGSERSARANISGGSLERSVLRSWVLRWTLVPVDVVGSKMLRSTCRQSLPSTKLETRPVQHRGTSAHL